MKLTYIATAADGTVSTRSSATMPYTHAVLVADPTGPTNALSWHKSEPAAAKAGSAAWNWHHRVEVVPVESYPYSSPKASAARAVEKTRRSG